MKPKQTKKKHQEEPFLFWARDRTGDWVEKPLWPWSEKPGMKIIPKWQTTRTVARPETRGIFLSFCDGRVIP